jgi:hypothetical protein
MWNAEESVCANSSWLLITALKYRRDRVRTHL